MVGEFVRLAMALTIIALISMALYQFSGRAGAVEAPAIAITNLR